MRSLLLLPVLLVPATAADPKAAVALVVDLKGAVTWQDGRKVVPARLMDAMLPGRRVVLAAGAKLVLVAMKGGERLAFEGPGAFILDGSGMASGLQPSVKGVPALKLARNLNPGELAQASLLMRVAPKDWEARLLRPGGRVAREAQTVLAWAPHPDAVAYSFVLKDPRGRTILSAETATPEARLPETVTLIPGARYSWWLRAEDAQARATAGAGDFTVLDAAARAVLDAALPAPGAEFADRLLYVALLIHFGLADEAEAPLKALRAERPGDPGLKKLGG